MIQNRKTSKPPNSQPDILRMKALLDAGGITLNSEQLDQLWRYHNLLRSRNQDRDLTRITGFEPMVIKHYIDSMVVGKFITLPSPLLDVGTGAGFPGIPLKIRYPHLKLILAEPRPRRVLFLEEACRTLQFKNTEVFEHKVVSRSFTKPVAAIITRALEEMDKTLLRTSGCLPVGGKAIFLKGPNVTPEIAFVRRRFGEEFKLILDREYRLAGTENERRLLVWERVLPPSEVRPTDSVQ